MINFLFQMSDADIFTLISCFFVAMSVIAVLLVKYFIPFHVREQDNAVIGNTAAVISVIYGLIAGFSALYLINNNSYTNDAVQHEVNALANLYRGSHWLKMPEQKNIQQEINHYLTHVVNIEWPKMEAGVRITEEGDIIIEKIADAIQNSIRTDTKAFLNQQNMLAEIKALHDARHQRINMSTARLDPELWVVILIGASLTLCITYLFGMNFYLHLITVIAAGLMTASTIFLLVTLDRPFQGEFGIEPNGFSALLKFIQKDTLKINSPSFKPTDVD